MKENILGCLIDSKRITKLYIKDKYVLDYYEYRPAKSYFFGLIGIKENYLAYGIKHTRQELLDRNSIEIINNIVYRKCYICINTKSEDFIFNYDNSKEALTNFNKLKELLKDRFIDIKEYL